MSMKRDYLASQRIELAALELDVDFYAVLMTAMRMADSDNLETLKHAFPGVYAELQERYNAPGGRKEDKSC